MRRTALLFIVILLAGCGEEKEQQPAPARPARLESLLGVERYALLGRADQIQVIRLAQKGNTWTESNGPLWKGARVSEVTALLLNDANYDESKKACKTNPGVLFRISKDTVSMDVRLCFECGIVEFYEFNDDGDPQRYAKQDFDRMFPQLAKLAKEAFPNDAEIQGLKEKK